LDSGALKAQFEKFSGPAPPDFRRNSQTFSSLFWVILWENTVFLDFRRERSRVRLFLFFFRHPMGFLPFLLLFLFVFIIFIFVFLPARWQAYGSAKGLQSRIGGNRDWNSFAAQKERDGELF